jgi:phosphatidylethanolamine-binding protein (PEBP) family uncharacterized protein
MTDFTVTSGLFGDGGTMPVSTVHPWAGGENKSPDLAWSGAPAGTQSFAVTIYDPDAPTTVGFVLLVLFNLSPGKYGGLLPPPGDPPHHYQITVYALDVPKLELGPATTYAFFRFSIVGHVLGEAKLTGRFGR